MTLPKLISLIAFVILCVALGILASLRLNVSSLLSPEITFYDYDLRMQKFQVDDQSHIEYWQWQRHDLVTPKNTWFIAGIGGPGGQIDSDIVNEYVSIFDQYVPSVDQLIIGQLRGHGQSTELHCLGDESYSACRKRIVDSGIDVTRYHFMTYAQDFNALRSHLNIDQWSVYGVSYSGRVAGAMLLTDSQNISAVLLDSPISLFPEQTTDALKVQAKTLYKFRAACLLMKSCLATLSNRNKQKKLDQFIDNFEQANVYMKGLNNVGLTKYLWIYGLFDLMYFDFDLAQQWVQLHIENPEGFDQDLVSDELMEHLLLNPTVYGVWPKAIVDYIAPIPSEFTHCNETVGESTFKEIDLGVYGKYLDIRDYCWTTPVHRYSIPDTQATRLVVAHSPFDPVIEQSDIQSYLTAFPQTQPCYILDAQHTVDLLKLIPLINALEDKVSLLPDFCKPDISKIVSQYPDFN